MIQVGLFLSRFHISIFCFHISIISKPFYIPSLDFSSIFSFIGILFVPFSHLIEAIRFWYPYLLTASCFDLFGTLVLRK